MTKWGWLLLIVGLGAGAFLGVVLTFCRGPGLLDAPQYRVTVDNRTDRRIGGLGFALGAGGALLKKSDIAPRSQATLHIPTRDTAAELVMRSQGDYTYHLATKSDGGALDVTVVVNRVEHDGLLVGTVATPDETTVLTGRPSRPSSASP